MQNKFFTKSTILKGIIGRINNVIKKGMAIFQNITNVFSTFLRSVEYLLCFEYEQ